MSICIMNKNVFKVLTSKNWQIQRIHKYNYHGTGPLFAYAIYLKPPSSSYRKYRIHIWNNMTCPGGRMQIISPRRKCYICELSKVSMGITRSNDGLIRVFKVNVTYGLIRDLDILIKLSSQDYYYNFFEVAEFFKFI